jgi:hypothetical protein
MDVCGAVLDLGDGADGLAVTDADLEAARARPRSFRWVMSTHADVTRHARRMLAGYRRWASVGLMAIGGDRRRSRRVGGETSARSGSRRVSECLEGAVAVGHDPLGDVRFGGYGF